ncbi:MAG: S-methyl-5-thioribose-1-phosphate isomerase [Marinilabiliales bacterium]|nr:S-methyl-5-thioribose-1-phosphate isomerase [Marinilabiliales bacterium]
MAQAIEKMVVRGAPAIGIAAAYGLVLGVMAMGAATGRSIDREFEKIYERLGRTRPTARNLFWALERMKAAYERSRAAGLRALREALLDEAKAIELEDAETNRAIGRHGQVLLRDGWTVLTHCNAGALATAEYGTALGVVRAAVAEGKRIRVFADETRPFLQGARLTVWELDRDGIPVVLITDSMAGWFMRRGEVQAVVVGADRIARNGDTANKIGTYSRGRPGQGERRPVLRRGPDVDDRPLAPRRRRHSHRGAQPGRGPRGGRQARDAAPRRGPQSRLRRHPGRLHHGHRHRTRHPPSAL